MTTAQGLGALAPVQRLQPLPRCLSRVLGTAGIVRQVFRHRLVGTPVAAVDSWGIDAYGLAIELAGLAFPRQQDFQLLCSRGAGITAAGILLL